MRHALVHNDVEKLLEMFWNGEQVVRFRVTENLHGPAELEAFRQSRAPTNLARTVKRLDIVSFGRDYASITLEFERHSEAGKVSGRQSQTWVRMADGWRIVQAHVSLLRG